MGQQQYGCVLSWYYEILIKGDCYGESYCHSRKADNTRRAW